MLHYLLIQRIIRPRNQSAEELCFKATDSFLQSVASIISYPNLPLMPPFVPHVGCLMLAQAALRRQVS